MLATLTTTTEALALAASDEGLNPLVKPVPGLMIWVLLVFVVSMWVLKKYAWPPIVEIIDIASQVGYQGIEPWLDELNRHKDAGGSLADLRKRFEDAGLEVAGAIDFFDWAVDDSDRRRKGLETAKRSMDLLQQIGGKRIAAPPAGATGLPPVELPRLVERYRALMELGDEFGVVPQVEVWGPSKTLGNLAEAAYVAMASSSDVWK